MFDRRQFLKSTALLPLLKGQSVLGAGRPPGRGDEGVPSRLFPFLDGQYTIQTIPFAGRDWTLDDYSCVGYELGQKGLGSVPCNVVTLNATDDITEALQDAINSVGSDGGGIVQIPAGTFTLSRSVEVPFSNVSIEGAGSGQTVINVPARYRPLSDPYEGVFTFGKTLGAPLNRDWAYRGDIATSVSTPVHRGDVYIDADDASSIQTGDWIVLEQYFWQDFVERNSSGPNAWLAYTVDPRVGPVPSANITFAFTYLRRVTGIAGNRVFIDAAIPWDLDPANNFLTIRFTRRGSTDRMVENVGSRGLTLNFETQTLAAGERPAGAGVYFEAVRNGWAYDVEVNNFPRNGFYSNFSARITFLDCFISGAQDYGSNGYGYGLQVYASQNVLIRRCSFFNARHNFILSRALTHMVVHTRCLSSNPFRHPPDNAQPDDTHHSFSHAVLWDRHTQMDGGSINAFYRGNSSPGAHETLGSGAIWNFEGDGEPGGLARGGQINVKPSPDGWGIVIGVNGISGVSATHTVWDNTQSVPQWVQGDQMLASPDLEVGPDPNALGNVLYEALYAGGMQPESLYEALLTNRLGTPPPDFRGPC